MGGALVVAFVGCSGDDDDDTVSPTRAPTETESASPATATTPAASAIATPLSCVVTPSIEEGPFFVDELLNRSDIRSDPGTGVEAQGVPVTLRFTVSQVDSAGVCTPLSGATVDVWQADANGLYSDEASEGTAGQKYLRGYQTTDANGQVEFISIFPGWYSGRTPHTHVKVRMNPTGDQGLEFTSQVYYDEAIREQVYQQAPYSSRGSPDTTNSTDRIYTSDTQLSLTPQGDGYVGTLHIGVEAV